MKILVPVKQILDPAVPIRLKADGSGLDTGLSRMVMNPFDEAALEEALRMKENGGADSIVAVTCGNQSCIPVLRSALAMGADQVLLLETDYAISPLVLARLLAAVVQREDCQLALVGRQGMGNDSNQVAPMLAALLDWPLLAFAEKIELHDATLTVLARSDAGNERLQAKLPAVVSVEVTANTPRFPKMSQLLGAKKQNIPAIAAAELKVDMMMQVSVVQLRNAPTRADCVIVDDVPTLVGRMLEKAGVRVDGGRR